MGLVVIVDNLDRIDAQKKNWGHPQQEYIFIDQAEYLQKFNCHLVREEFRKNCRFPVVFWVSDRIKAKLIQSAPNLESWGTSTAFQISDRELAAFIEEKAAQLFAIEVSIERRESVEPQNAALLPNTSHRIGQDIARFASLVPRCDRKLIGQSLRVNPPLNPPT